MSRPEPNIRSFRPEDCCAVALLASELGLAPWTASDYESELQRPGSQMLTAMIGPTLAGFIAGRRIPGSGPDERPDVEIYNVGVAEEFQRTGIGSQMINQFLSISRTAGARAVWLEVRSRNVAAIRFYRGFGFAEVFIRRNYYREPVDDAAIMRLSLDPPES